LEETITSILTQRNIKGEELPISFIRKILHDYGLKYSNIEKQYISLFKAVAHFRTCILPSHVIAYFPNSPVKMFLIQQLREGKWANWLEKIQECDIEIKPLKVVRGQGLCKLMTGSNSLNGFILISTGSSTATPEWYKYIVFYLKYGQFPNKMSLK
jgi:hypothetical protein